ncbi:MAG: HEAT repeat domain-containing protein [Alphaproteobacteria bacterium]|nr:HEAT repeat domain-containing protein [Alphaproteobacteria bacterium]
MVLAACSGIYSNEIAPSTYAIRGAPPLGALGGPISTSALEDEASQLCPDGYRKIGERTWVAEVEFREWRVLCLAKGENPLGVGGIASLLIERIRSERDTRARTELATELANLSAENAGSTEIDEDMIDAISSLLSDRDDSVRFWAALSLGQFGKRASRAVPALNRALKEADERDRSMVLGPDLGSADAIHSALQKIQGPTAPSG